MFTFVSILFVIAWSFFLSNLVIPKWIAYSHKKQQFDLPDERKHHRIPTPSSGGLGIIAGLLPVAFIAGDGSTAWIALIASLAIMTYLGYRDDKVVLKALPKFGIQVAIACLLFLSGFRIESLHGLMGIEGLPMMVQAGLTIFLILAITNAYNLIDGIDGLSGGLGIIASLSFATFFYLTGNTAMMLMAASLAAGMLAFMRYNFAPAKVFMGDAGTLPIGLLLSVFVISLIQTPLPSMNIAAILPMSLAMVFVPLIDTTQVFSSRILSGVSPFTADRRHLHHKLLESGLDHKKASASLWMIELIAISIIGYLTTINALLALLSIAGLGLIVVSGIKYAATPTSSRLSLQKFLPTAGTAVSLGVFVFSMI